MSRYQDAGVDVNAGYELVHRIKDAVKSTDRPGLKPALDMLFSSSTEPPASRYEPKH